MHRKEKKERIMFWIVLNSRISKKRIIVSSEHKLDGVRLLLKEATVIIPKCEIDKTREENSIKIKRVEEIFG